MESIKIEIINPQAKKLIINSADMDIIRIKKENSNSEFTQLLARLLKNAENAPSPEEISKEVELSRVTSLRRAKDGIKLSGHNQRQNVKV